MTKKRAAKTKTSDAMTDDTNEESADNTEAKPLGDGAGVYIPGASDDEEPPIDFGSFVLSLGTSAYVSLGKVDDPELRAEGEDRDLAAAKQVIDILKMLQDKTAGNLEPEEDRLLAGLIYELKMAYVEAN